MTSSTESQKPVPAWRTWTLRVAGSLLLTLLLVGIAEGALRLFGVGFSTDVTVPCTLKGKPAACYNLFFPAPFFPPGMIKTPQAYAIPEEKRPGTVRIVVLGESAAMGDPDPAYGFSRYLEVMLRDRFPTLKFEIINTGSVAINSHVLLPIARGLARQQPDIFIIYSGNNEVVGPYGPGTVLSSSAMNLSLIRASILARSSRIGQLVTKLGEQKREWGGMEMFLDKQVPARSPLLQRAYQNFEANLRDTVEVAHRAGARVLVATVATNLQDCAPFASQHRDGLREEDLHAWTDLVQHGIALEESKTYGEALNEYQAASKLDDQYAELEFRIARSFWMLGNYGAAREHFVRARDLDTLRFRADSKINDINRSVASSTAGAELVDADAIFAKESPNGVIGNQLVYEHVHLTPEGNYLLARAMFAQIASRMANENHGAGATDTQKDPPALTQAECEQLLALTSHDRLRITREMLQRLQKPPFTNQVNHSDQLLRLSIKANAPEENPNQTSAEYQWAIRKNGDDRILHYNYGLFLFDYDQTAAAEQLRQARPWDGFPVFTPDGRLIE